jgi:hypothetical protein
VTAGRPTKYSEELTDRICLAISEGESLTSICLAGDMPGTSTVYDWLRDNEDFSDKYAQARLRQGHTYADAAMDAAHRAVSSESNTEVQGLRLLVDTLKWAAGKRQPKVYGDKLDVEAQVTPGVQIINLPAAGTPEADGPDHDLLEGV